jgi:hypothetical protein
MKREIEKNPAVPYLSDHVVQLLTDLCFRPDDPVETAGLIFQFSTADQVEKVAAIIDGLLAKNISKKVFVTGGIPKYDDAIKKSESKAILDLIDQDKYPGVLFYYEARSNNTLENVTEALKVLDFSNYKTILFIYKCHAARRGYLTLKKLLPATRLIQKTYSTLYTNAERVLDINTWPAFEFGRSRVWGEYLRIKRYSQAGDIAMDEESSELISRIESSI